MDLTGKQKKFVQGVVQGKTYTQAALDAGYSKKTAASTGSENMQKPIILKAIEAEQEEERLRIQRHFANTVGGMLNELVRVYYDEDTPPHVKNNIFNNIADRAGYKPVEKSEVDMTADVDIGEQSQLFEKYLKDVNGGDEG